MVFLHGAGYHFGSSGIPLYDGTALAAKHDVVVVGVNHRLNVFGFLYLVRIGGAKYADSGNVEHLREGREALQQNAERLLIWPRVRKNRMAALGQFDQLVNQTVQMPHSVGRTANPLRGRLLTKPSECSSPRG
jgi:hypothetical protein